MMLGNLDIHMQKKKLDPSNTEYIKSNSKRIKILNTGPETMKLLKENTGESFKKLNLVMIFQMIPKVQTTKVNRQIGLD